MTWRVAGRYMRIHPDGLRSRVSLYRAMLRAARAKRKDPANFTGVGYFLDRPILVRTLGLRLRVRPHCDDLVFALVDHKPEMARWFAPRPDEVVVDVGSHLGMFSLLAAATGARTVALEPNPETFRALTENVRLNPGLTVTCLNLAVGGERSETDLFVVGGSSGFGSLDPSWAERFKLRAEPTAKVRVETLDDIASEQGFDHVEWLLIDAEGSESEVLRGASGILRRTRNVIVEVASGENETRCGDLLREADLRVVERVPQNEVNSYWLATRGSVPDSS